MATKSYIVSVLPKNDFVWTEIEPPYQSLEAALAAIAEIEDMDSERLLDKWQIECVLHNAAPDAAHAQEQEGDDGTTHTA